MSLLQILRQVKQDFESGTHVISRSTLKDVKNIMFADPILEMPSAVSVLLDDIFTIFANSSNYNLKNSTTSYFIVCVLVSDQIKTTTFDILRYWTVVIGTCPLYVDTVCLSMLWKDIKHQRSTSWLSGRILLDMIKSTKVSQHALTNILTGELNPCHEIFKANSDLTACHYLAEILSISLPGVTSNIEVAHWVFKYLSSFNPKFKNSFQLKSIECMQKKDINNNLEHGDITYVQFIETKIMIIWLSNNKKSKNTFPVFLDLKRIKLYSVTNKICLVFALENGPLNNTDISQEEVTITFDLVRSESFALLVDYFRGVKSKISTGGNIKFISMNDLHSQHVQVPSKVYPPVVQGTVVQSICPNNAMKETDLISDEDRLSAPKAGHISVVQVQSLQPRAADILRLNNSRLIAVTSNESVNSRLSTVAIQSSCKVVHAELSRSASLVASRRPFTEISNRSLSEALHTYHEDIIEIPPFKRKPGVIPVTETQSQITQVPQMAANVSIVASNTKATENENTFLDESTRELIRAPNESSDRVQNVQTDLAGPQLGDIVPVNSIDGAPLETTGISNEASFQTNGTGEIHHKTNEVCYDSIQNSFTLFTSTLINKVKALEVSIATNRAAIIREMNNDFHEIEVKHRANLLKMKEHYESEFAKVFGNSN